MGLGVWGKERGGKKKRLEKEKKEKTRCRSAPDGSDNYVFKSDDELCVQS